MFFKAAKGGQNIADVFSLCAKIGKHFLWPPKAAENLLVFASL